MARSHGSAKLHMVVLRELLGRKKCKHEVVQACLIDNMLDSWVAVGV